MGIDLIFKVALVGILVAILNAILNNSEREVEAMLTSLAGLIVILMMIISEIDHLFDAIRAIFNF